MKTYKEITNDNGYAKQCNASNNEATYIITSSLGHDLYNEFVQKHDRLPSSSWYNRNFRFKLVK